MKVYFNKYRIERPDTHFVYTLAFKSANGKTCFKDGVISFFNVGKAEDFADAVLKYTTQFVRDNLIFLEISLPNRNPDGYYGHGHFCGYGHGTTFYQMIV